jgi:large subunit ribosomal protein L24
MKPKLSIRKDDRVMVTAGKDKGKIGKVLRVMPAKQSALVEKVNMIKRHTRPNAKGQGGIVEREAPIHVSNLAVLCTKCNEPARLGSARLEDGSRARVCKKCGEQQAG